MSACGYIGLVVSIVGVFVVWTLLRIARAMEVLSDEHASDALARRGRR